MVTWGKSCVICLTILDSMKWWWLWAHVPIYHSLAASEFSPRSLWISASSLALQSVRTEMKISLPKPDNGFSISFLQLFYECHADILSPNSLCTSVTWQKDQMELFMPEKCSASGCSLLALQAIIWIAIKPSLVTSYGSKAELNSQEWNLLKELASGCRHLGL